jgi:hypothetical protein
VGPDPKGRQEGSASVPVRLVFQFQDQNVAWLGPKKCRNEGVHFRLLYLNDSEHAGNQVISADWVHESLQSYSEDAFFLEKVGRYLGDIGYGYEWWSASSTPYRVNDR